MFYIRQHFIGLIWPCHNDYVRLPPSKLWANQAFFIGGNSRPLFRFYQLIFWITNRHFTLQYILLPQFNALKLVFFLHIAKSYTTVMRYVFVVENKLRSHETFFEKLNVNEFFDQNMSSNFKMQF